MSDIANDSRLMAALLRLPHSATGRTAGTQTGAATGFANRLARLTAGASTGTSVGNKRGVKSSAAAGMGLPAAQHPPQTQLAALDAAMRPDHAAEALAGQLDGHIAWQQSQPHAVEAAIPEVATVPLPQVANTVATALYRGATRVHLQVMPPQLGTVDVIVHLQAGVMQVALQTETVETLEALQKDLPNLRETLRGAGLNIGALRLTLRRGRR